MTVTALEIIPLMNPFLPIKVNQARLVYNSHTFIHYLDYDALRRELNYIQDNINALTNAFNKLNTPTNSLREITQTLSIKDTQETFDNLFHKYNNLYPNLSHRVKRGLINPIGSLYNAAFGLLDHEDGERIDQAITALDKNQQNLYKSMSQQMSLSTQIINRLNNTLSTIYQNQQTIGKHVNSIQTNVDNYIRTSLKLLTLQEIKRHIITDCIRLTQLIDEIENAITFAKFHTIHPSFIHTEEIQDMLHTLEKHYNENNIVRFKSLRSYYDLLKVQVLFNSGKIIFTINFPIITNETFELYQVIPIPSNNTLFIPTSLYTLRALTTNYQYMMDLPCPEIEYVTFCPTDSIKPADKCMTSALSTNPPDQCTIRMVHVQVTMTQLLDNNLIIIPKPQERLYTRCASIEEIQILTQPVLIKTTPACTIRIEDRQFDFSNKTYNSTPLILSRIIIPEQWTTNSKFKPIELRNPHVESILELKKLIHQQEPLIPIDYATHSYSGIIIIIIIFICIIVGYIIYRYFGCNYLAKKTAKVTQTVINLARETQPKIAPAEIQEMQHNVDPLLEATAPEEFNTNYSRSQKITRHPLGHQ